MNKKTRGPKPTKRNGVILALRNMKRATAADLGVATAYLDTLVRGGYVAVVGHQIDKQGKGRKPNIYKLTPAGQGQATSLIRRSV
jgi:hypothetical protein